MSDKPNTSFTAPASQHRTNLILPQHLVNAQVKQWQMQPKNAAKIREMLAGPNGQDGFTLEVDAATGKILNIQSANGKGRKALRTSPYPPKANGAGR